MGDDHREGTEGVVAADMISVVVGVEQVADRLVGDLLAYTTPSVNISSFAGQTIRILIQVADAGSASLVEAAVDNVTITQQ